MPQLGPGLNTFKTRCSMVVSIRISRRLVNCSWDSHIHIIDPKNYPFPNIGIPTIPHERTMAGAFSNASRLSLPNMVFVQVSKYSNDNTWILDALREVGPSRGRGVVAFDPDTIDSQTFRKWRDLSVRGVRLNLRLTRGKVSKIEIQAALHKYAGKSRLLKMWPIGPYTDMVILEYIQSLVSEPGVKIVIEYFGSPKIMDDPLVYAKISAPYILSKDPEFKDLEGLLKSLLGMRDREGVMFASDWPYTQCKSFDTKPFLEKYVE
ncbi:TIM barrel metal-dependent hydrolase [Rhexocercosporidium sp. MPI-PUGE-AT-0058]|nr:TIM barrel metal-dependent hydrolase [Rhexocercosporidium sp. MPI-PUGE-AT-0058]